MESLGDLLGRYTIKEPDEVQAIKRYISEQFNAESSVGLQGDTALIITVASAALANTLRLRTPAIQKAAGTAKRLVFRIG
jgi:hypothetical protein